MTGGLGRVVTAMCLLATAVAGAVLAPAAEAAGPGPGGATQQIVVTGAYGSHSAILAAYQYVAGGWRLVLSAPAEVGYNGLSDDRREGDGTTPTGTYSFGSTMYGLSPVQPSARYGYHRLACGDWWDENPASPTYNRFVRRPCGAPGPGGGSEALWTETVAYQRFALINFNVAPAVPGRGAGIFLHDFTRSGVTAGCVALPAAQLDTVLGWLDPAQHPVIRIGTTSEVGPPEPAYSPARNDVSAVATRDTGSGRTEVHTLTAASGFTQYRTHAATALGPVSLDRWQFRFGDFDGDGISDLWAIDTLGGSGHTEVHILSGASGYRTYLLHGVTVLPHVSLRLWTFGVADADGDGRADLYAVNTADIGSHSTAMFAWDGHRLAQVLVAQATPLGQVSLTGNAFLIGDDNLDGRPDLWDIRTAATGSGRTEVHIVDGARPTRFLLHAASGLAYAPLDRWSFALGNPNADSRPDLYAVNSQDSGHVAVHIFDGVTPTRALAHVLTPLTARSLTVTAFGTG